MGLVFSSSGQADWIGHDIDPVDSCDLTFASLCRARDVMRQDRKSEAFVMCCGTDAMEDVAYAAALLFDRERPVVLTGAAIPGGSANADGPRNLADAANHLLTADDQIAGLVDLLDGEHAYGVSYRSYRQWRCCRL
ncbi:MAG: asparaginase domain-containing protein [Trinickia sp.]|uniref:asparaginase domain-containing protein n=1 Tax=Trinickia sp. TaxID=2571163 RepID=UPI003F7CFD4F